MAHIDTGALLGNAKWIAFSQFTKLILQFVGYALIARELDPNQMGLMAIVIVITNFGGLIRDFGMGPLLVKAKNPLGDLFGSIFWINIVFAVTIGFLLYLAASTLEDLFSLYGLGDLLRTSSPLFLLMGLGSGYQAMLERESSFAKITIAEVSSYLPAIALALLLAKNGFGALALVYQSLLYAGIYSALMATFAENRNSFLYSFKTSLGVFREASGIVCSNFFWYASKNFDTILLGSFYLPNDLGLYSIGQRLLNVPNALMNQIANRALLPILRTQHRSIGISSVSRLQYLYSIPAALLYCSISQASDPYISLVFGSQWSEAAKLAPALCLSAYLAAQQNSFSALFISAGKTKFLATTGLATTGLFFLLIIVWPKRDGTIFDLVTYFPLPFFLSLTFTVFCFSKSVLQSSFAFSLLIRPVLLYLIIYCYYDTFKALNQLTIQAPNYYVVPFSFLLFALAGSIVIVLRSHYPSPLDKSQKNDI